MALMDRLRNRLVDLFGGITKEELKVFEKEADQRVNEAIDFASSGDDEPTYYGYRGYGQALRDLLAGRHKAALEASWEMYITNPLAKRLLELKRDFIVGEGITFQAEDDSVQEVLESFWNDPVNRLDSWVFQMALELGLWGEQIYPVFVRTGEDVGWGDNRVRCGVIDPLRVRKVVTDPENVRIKTEVHVVGPGNRTIKYGIVRASGEGKDRGKLVVPENFDGKACFYFSVNSLSNSTRGIPDLLAQSDWLKQYDQYLFNVLEREAFIKYFVWDLLMKGATKEQIRARLKEVKMPRPGSVLGHNENEEWKPISPDLHQAGSQIAGRQILTHIVGTFGFPEHWFGRGEAATRATAKEMGEPVIKSLTSRQRYFREMLRDMLKFVIDQAIIAGKVKEEVERKFVLNMPDVSVRDTGTAATALLQASQALVLATQQRYVTQEKAVEIFGQISAQLGVEIDVKKTVEDLPKRDEDYGGDGHGKLEEALELMGTKANPRERGFD